MVRPEPVYGEFGRFSPNNRTSLPHEMLTHISYQKIALIRTHFSHRCSSIHTLLINFNSTYYYLRCEVRVLVSASYNQRR